MFAVSTYHLSLIVFEIKDETWPLLLKIEHMVKLQVLGNNSKTVNNIKNLICSKNDQHIKIYIPCNFEINVITHLGVIALPSVSYSF
jgi:5-formyltetrahydrofolate cyclo-ligase